MYAAAEAGWVLDRVVAPGVAAVDPLPAHALSSTRLRAKTARGGAARASSGGGSGTQAVEHVFMKNG